MIDCWRVLCFDMETALLPKALNNIRGSESRHVGTAYKFEQQGCPACILRLIVSIYEPYSDGRGT